MDNDYDDDEERSNWLAPVAVVVLALAAIGAFLFFRDDDKSTGTAATTAAPIADELPEPSVPLTPRSVAPAGPPIVTVTTQVQTTTAPVETTTAPVETSTTLVAPETPTSAAPVTSDVPAIATYPTTPDGTPLPILAIYRPGEVVLGGYVPDEAAKAKLISLALANARDPANTAVNTVYLGINPSVPPDIGVRVIETTSTRFDAGSSEVVPNSAHSAELDRVVNVMNALPNITALVIGHADQRGNAETNYKLSAARAQAVVDYMVSKGIQASRLSSRAVGEADLLALGSDDTALALNRRTEFTIYGLLLP